MKTLRDINWLHLGMTDEYSDLKKWIAHICHDVTHAACIDELCLSDIVVGFHQKGFSIVDTKELAAMDNDFSTLRDEYNLEVELATNLGIYLDHAHNDVEEISNTLSAMRQALAESFDLAPDYPDFQDAEHLKDFIIGRLSMYRSIIDEKAATIKEWEENFRKRRANIWSPWIACKDRMPEPGQCVLMWIQPNTYIPGNAKEGAYMPMVNPHWPWRSTWDMATYNPEDITHWLPMPRPPEVEE